MLVPGMPSTEITFAALSDVGRQRDHNEDTYLVDHHLGLFVVCDGMGGHAAGEVASALAVKVFHDCVKRDAWMLEGYASNKRGPDKVTRKQILSLLENSINQASSLVHAEAQKDPNKRGMGTTLVAIVIAAKQAFVVWVGDSRIYLLRDSVLEQLTEDHSVFNELLKRKKMSREDIEKLPQKNAITRAIGVYEHTEPESLVLDLVAGDRFLLCTDGLHGYFDDDLDELSNLLGTTEGNRAVEKLIAAANERGGKDNITSVVVTFGDVSKRDENYARRVQLKRDILARMPLFRALNDREILRLLQVVEVHPYKDADVVIREGDRGEELFIVLTGSVKVMRGETELARLKPGDHFGEMALVRNQPRSATVLSDLDSELMVIRRTDFFDILRNEHQLAVKLLWQFLGVLADRLDDTNRELGQAREELATEDVTAEIFEVIDDGARRAQRGASVPAPDPRARS
jgi:serine/threonine protein phosphatase PrpC/CRP-like cAMP-binding protein